MQTSAEAGEVLRSPSAESIEWLHQSPAIANVRPALRNRNHLGEFFRDYSGIVRIGRSACMIVIGNEKPASCRLSISQVWFVSSSASSREEAKSYIQRGRPRRG